MKICYTPKKFKPATLDRITQANEIIEDYARQGLTLTLRQLYYQFVARGMIPNEKTEYSKLGDVVSDARMAGLLDWNAIIDRTRYLRGHQHFETPREPVVMLGRSYRIDLWTDQPQRVEVWIEKEALVGVIAGVCSKYDVDFFACKGYVSQSEMWSAGRRLIRYMQAGQRVHIIHLGDHDPSGVDMTRDIQDRLAVFCETEGFEPPSVIRKALNRDQVRRYNPPPNPAKLKDSRAKDYIQKHGRSSWELDALEPSVLVDLVGREIRKHMDATILKAAENRQDTARKQLTEVGKRWPEVAAMISQQKLF